MFHSIHGEETDLQSPSWFCIRTKPKCEDLASRNIAIKNITVFNPKIEELYKRSTRIAPVFPSYIFAKFSLPTEFYKVLWTKGVKQILGCGDRPTPIDDEVILLIMDNLEGGEYVKPRFNPGDIVKVKDGVFSDLIGIFQTYRPGKERVKVLLELFNQPVEVELDLVNIERVKLAHS